MSIVCLRYRAREIEPLRAAADLGLALDGGVQLEVKNWSLYVKDGQRYLNPPSIRYNGGISNIIRIPRKRDREVFRAAALAAIDSYNAAEVTN